MSDKRFTLHYKVINTFLDSYIKEGVNPIDYLEYINKDEANFKLAYNKVLSKCTMAGLEIDENLILEDFKDMIRDRIGFINDITKIQTK